MFELGNTNPFVVPSGWVIHSPPRPGEPPYLR
jgi:hypothetical protein